MSRVHRTIAHRQNLSSLPDDFFAIAPLTPGGGGDGAPAATTDRIPAEYRRGGGGGLSSSRSLSLGVGAMSSRSLSLGVGGMSARSLGLGLGDSATNITASAITGTTATTTTTTTKDAKGATTATAGGSAVGTTPAGTHGHAIAGHGHTAASGAEGHHHSKASTACNFLSLLIGAIGVVFGDIGTSPLYTLNTVLANIPLFKGTDRTLVNRSEIVVATYCLMFYTLVWVVLIKYVLWVMRVHHHGAGGELAMAQVILKGLDPTRGEGEKAREYKLPLPGTDVEGNTANNRSLHRIASEGVLEEMMDNQEATTTTTTNGASSNTASSNGNYYGAHAAAPTTTTTTTTPAATTTPTETKQQLGIRKRSTIVMTIAMMSTGFLIGDGVITPPNTVLGALHSPVLAHVSTSLNVLLSCLVLIFIFNVQKFGSQVIGYVSGPIMIVWFLILAILGGMAIGRYPEEARFMLRAFNPASLVEFSGGEEGVYPPHVGFYNAFLSLSGVILCITGAEALYADLGHFGYRAIMVAWCTMIFPALALHYFGQCCYVISLGRDMELYPPSMATTEEYQALVDNRELFNTQLIEVPGNLVYALVPTQDMSHMAGQACLWLLTIVAVLASIIASQALISGVFSILTQAYALELMPRMTILHTNPNEKGQVFIREANTIMCIMCVLIVLLFQTSDKLTAAYGIAVAFCMFFTDVLMGFVMNWVWKFHWIVAIACCVPFVFVDGLYLSANVLKLGEGAESWISICIAFVAWFCMQAHWWTKTTVKAKASGGGSTASAPVVMQQPSAAAAVVGGSPTTTAYSTDIDHLVRLLNESKLLTRMPVAGVFLTPYPNTYPRCLSTLARSMAALPETIILLHISFSRDKPYVADEERYDLICHDEVLGVYSLNLYFGYAEPITADHFDVTNSLRDIFESECYAALRKLTEDRSRASKRDGLTRTVSNWARINERLTESMLLAPFEEFGTKDTSSSRENHHWTYFLGVRKYVPHAKENVFTRLFVHTCDFLSRNSKSSRDFFGLTSVDTIEVSCVTMIRTKDHPEETEEEEMLELTGMDAGEQA